MKVLRKGRLQKGWATKQTCTGEGNGKGGCGARLLVEHADLFHTSRSDYGGDTDYFVTFKCPECEVLTDIPDDKVPFRARELPHQREWEKEKRKLLNYEN